MAEQPDYTGTNGDAPEGVVGEIFRMYLDGMGLAAIADDLKARGMRKPAHRKWHMTSLRDILSTEVDRNQPGEHDGQG